MDLKVARIMQEALNSMTDDAFQGVGAALSQSREAVREQIQDQTSSRILVKEVINKLSLNQRLTSEDIALMRLWIVGDAESYALCESNLNDWLEEYKRLAGALAGYENRACDAGDLFKLGGLLEDAERVTYDIANLLEKKERINKFEAAVSDGLDPDERETLVDVLNEKLRS